MSATSTLTTNPATTCAQGHVALPVATAPSTSPVAAYQAAMGRARKNGVEVIRTSATTWQAPSTSRPDTCHTVSKTGPRWYDMACTCEAGQHGRVCLHMAVAVASYKYNLSRIAFKKPASTVVATAPVLCDTCQSPSPDAERCAECVALYGAVGTPVELTPMYLDTMHAMERFAPAIQPTPISPALIQASLAADRARNEAAHAERHAADRVYVAAQRRARVDPLFEAYS